MNFFKKNIIIYYTLLPFLAITISGCGIYSFTGAKIDAKTVQIDYFPNNASFVEPTLSAAFTNALQDFFQSQTSLNLVKSEGELLFEGEITNYSIQPTSATANQTAALNRLTITVNVRFYNNLNPDDNFEKTFSHYVEYGANVQLTGSALEDVYEEIFDRIVPDIFNESVAKW